MWGERSCKHKTCPIPDERDWCTCNVNCRMYEWNGLTEPDSEKLKPHRKGIKSRYLRKKKPRIKNKRRKS